MGQVHPGAGVRRLFVVAICQEPSVFDSMDCAVDGGKAGILEGDITEEGLSDEQRFLLFEGDVDGWGSC